MTTNSDLLQRRVASVPRGIGSATGMFAARAENAELWDVEGRRYIAVATSPWPKPGPTSSTTSSDSTTRACSADWMPRIRPLDS